jgi:hypothetical protein
LSNAVKFTGEGGRIRIRAKTARGAVQVSIEDTGCGIPPSALKRLGRPFEQVQNQLTRDHSGSGLGLAIAKSLTELHGGSLKIRSKPKVGTIVAVRIPCSGEPVKVAAETENGPEDPARLRGDHVGKRRGLVSVPAVLAVLPEATALAPAIMPAIAYAAHFILFDRARTVDIHTSKHLFPALRRVSPGFSPSLTKSWWD